jgi:hypothetical protein
MYYGVKIWNVLSKFYWFVFSQICSRPNGKLRQSSRKRKAGQTHPPPHPPPPPTTNQAREITGAVLNLLSEMLMTGLSEDGPLELEFAKLGAAIADSRKLALALKNNNTWLSLHIAW